MTKAWMLAAILLGAVMHMAVAAETEFHPVANPKAVVLEGQARFTLLSPAMIRMEWASNGQFEDRASQVFINRNQPIPRFEATSEDGWLQIRTDKLTVRYRKDGGRFSADNLSIQFTLNDKPVTWKPGMKDTGNLLGTCRTLDGVSGATSLEAGLMSRDGWVLVDDSDRLVFTDTTPRWMVRRHHKDAIDWYFLGYGHDYKQTLKDFCKVAGHIPLPPRFVFGTWWSRYWAYTDAELRDLVAQFDKHQIPLDVLVVDMDWHLDGWTGYTWNKEYFPDPKGFLAWAHKQGLRTTLNLHPADGVGKHEAAFEDMAQALELDPKKTENIPFDCTSPRFMDAYFRILHHPMERDGVDFWWLDWQQGTGSLIAGLDPLWWLNYLHWQDMEERTGTTHKRPLIFSRWGGLGNHRYQIGFSGDTFCNWPSLAFQPFFTSTAGNVGFAYWSHDIGGHQPGPVDPELYARWIQFGAFSPVLRTHTTKNPLAERRIWEFPQEVFHAAAAAFRLRYSLIPYIYTTARQCYDTGLPMCRPLYYEWPELPEAYEHEGEYLFGDQLLVAPVTQPADPASGCAQVRLWLPPGTWINWYTGQTYTGPTDARLLVPLDQIPFFVRAGAIIPTMPRMTRTDAKPVDPLTLHIFPGDSGSFGLYEDDGTSPLYRDGRFAVTPVSSEPIGDTLLITIGPANGSFPGMLKERAYQVRVRDVWPPKDVSIRASAPKTPEDMPSWQYEPFTQTIAVTIPARPVSEQIEIIVTRFDEAKDTELLRNGLRGEVFTLGAIRNMLPRDVSTVSAYGRIDQYVKNTMKILGNVKQGIDARLKAARSYVESPVVFAKDVAASPAAKETRIKALMQLLGLYRQVRVVPDPTTPGKLVAEIEIATTLRNEFIQKLEGNAKLTVAEPWKIEGSSEWSFKGLSDEEPFVARVPLTCEGQPDTGTLQLEMNLGLQDSLLTLPMEKVFLPSINAWWIVGPFACPLDKGLDTPFPPEESIDLAATYDGQDNQKIAWREVRRTIRPNTDLTDEFFIDFDDIFGGRKYNGVAYAFCTLDAPEDMDAVLAMGTDDGVLVWLNGTEVHRYEQGRAYTSKQDNVPVKLRKGENTLLLKISQGGGDWGFCVHVETPGGRPATQVRTRLEPKPAK